MNARIMALAGVALAAVVALSIAGTYRWASAKGPDVNNDGWVTAEDIFTTIGSFGEAVPIKAPPVRRETKGLITAHNWDSVISFCEEGETVLGGGYTLASIGFNDKVHVDAPYTDGASGLDGWLVTVINDSDFNIQLWVQAICSGP